MRHVAVSALLGLSAVIAGCQEYSIKGEPDDPEVGTDTGIIEDTDTDPPTPPPTPAQAPDIEVEPLTLPFGFLPSQCLSEPELVTVRNVGAGDLQINDIFFVDSVGAFQTTAGGALTLAPGESYQFYVEFQPPVEGQWLDTVRIASNDPDESIVDVLADGTGANEGLITDTFTQNPASTVDVLFVLDNSGSMSDNLNALANQFPVFINAFVGLGLDYQIGVVTTDMDDPAQSGNLIGPIVSSTSADPVAEFVAMTSTGSGGSGDERGLDAAFTALDPSAGLITTTNAGLVRPGSNLSIIVVSDENDGSNMNPVPFSDWLDQYQGDPDLTSLSIVGGPKQGLFPCTSGFFSGVTAQPVPRYWNVANRTGGIHANLCNLSFNDILQQLSTVAAGLRIRWALSGVPDDPTTIQVLVDGVALPEDANNGWTYDANANSVEFHGNGVPAQGAVVEIVFEGETTCPQ